ncbi:MAG TPA: chromate transporter [Rhodocyclaceae bacterium]
MVSLGELALRFLLLSLMAFGGGNATLPEMHRVVVEQYHWLSDTAFSELFAVAQAAPGPNVLIVALIGLALAGLPGALVVTAAFCIPSSLLMYGFARWWSRLAGNPWQRIAQTAVAPLATGLVLASGWLMAATGAARPAALLLTLATVVAVLSSRCNPLWWIVVGAVLGLVGVV